MYEIIGLFIGFLIIVSIAFYSSLKAIFISLNDIAREAKERNKIEADKVKIDKEKIELLIRQDNRQRDKDYIDYGTPNKTFAQQERENKDLLNTPIWDYLKSLRKN